MKHHPDISEALEKAIDEYFELPEGEDKKALKKVQDEAKRLGMSPARLKQILVGWDMMK